MTVKTTNWRATALALLTVGALATGCAKDDGGQKNGTREGQSQAAGGQGSAQPSSTEVDLAALDTGTWPTEPAPPFGHATKENITEIDGQRLAEFVVAPFEVDPVLATALPMPKVIHNSTQMVDYLAGASTKVLQDEVMLYGFMSPAEEPSADMTKANKSLINGAWRFPSPDAARRAATRLHQEATGGGKMTEVDPRSMPGSGPHMVDTLVSQGKGSSLSGDSIATQAYTAHGDYVLYQWAEAPKGQESWTAETVAKTVAQQAPLAAAFPKTPTREQSGGADPQFPLIDQDTMLVYVIPFPKGQATGADDMAVYGPRGMAHRSTNPPLTFRTLTENGSEHNATGRTTVYRAKDDAGAQKIVDAFAGDAAAKGAVPAEPPKGLPSATCTTVEDEKGTREACTVGVGRYVGAVSGTDKKEVDQLTSAQYLILTKADQDAGK